MLGHEASEYRCPHCGYIFEHFKTKLIKEDVSPSLAKKHPPKYQYLCPKCQAVLVDPTKKE